jgi:hypothetical protein
MMKLSFSSTFSFVLHHRAEGQPARRSQQGHPDPLLARCGDLITAG